MIHDIGRVCIKIAGKEAGRTCVIIDRVNDTRVMVDGNVRRKHCSVTHLEPLEQVLNIKKGASTEEVQRALKNAELNVKEKVASVKKEKKTEKTAKPVKKTAVKKEVKETKKKTAKK